MTRRRTIGRFLDGRPGSPVDDAGPVGDDGRAGGDGWAGRLTPPPTPHGARVPLPGGPAQRRAGARRRRISALQDPRRSHARLVGRLVRAGEALEALVRADEADEDAGASLSAAGRWRSPGQRAVELALLARVALLQLRLLRERLLETLQTLEETMDFWQRWAARPDASLAARGAAVYWLEVRPRHTALPAATGVSGSWVARVAAELRALLARKVADLARRKERMLPVLGSVQRTLQALERTLPSEPGADVAHATEAEAAAYVAAAEDAVPTALNALLMVDAATARLPVFRPEPRVGKTWQSAAGARVGGAGGAAPARAAGRGVRAVSRSPANVGDSAPRHPPPSAPRTPPQTRGERDARDGDARDGAAAARRGSRRAARSADGGPNDRNADGAPPPRRSPASLYGAGRADVGPPAWQAEAMRRANDERPGPDGRSWAWAWAHGDGRGEAAGWRETLRSEELAAQVARSLAAAEGEPGRPVGPRGSSQDHDLWNASSNGRNAADELARALALRGLARPRYWAAKTPEVLTLLGAVLAGCVALAHYRGRATAALARGWNGAKVWWFLHVTEPAQEMFSEVVYNEMLSVADLEAMEDSRRSLRKMIRDWLQDTRGAQHDLTPSQIERAARRMDMRVVSEAYDEEVKRPVTGLVRGEMARLALIQVQFIKKELLAAMAAMDELLRENHFSAQLLATIPALLGVGCLGVAARGVYRRFQRYDSALERSGALRQRAALLLRGAELLLRQEGAGGTKGKATETGAGSDGTGGEPTYALSARDMGELTLLLRLLEALVLSRRRQLRLSAAAWEAFTDDLAELMDPALPLSVRVRTIGRMFRTYNFLAVSHHSRWREKFI
jgi:hypothetical protein